MASRRMFSLNIMNSARFLKMPADTQNLYFHLTIRADDDGIVEAFPVMRMVGSSEDNLRVLHAKQFIHVLNEDLVTYITDWREHNNLRADRKIDSIYKDLLIKILPEVEILEPKARVDVKNNSKRVKNGQSTDGQKLINGQSTDGLVEGSIGKVSLDKISVGNSSEKNIATIATLFNQNYGDFIGYNSELVLGYLDEGMNEEVIIEALKEGIESCSPNKPNLKYLKKILNSWVDANVLTMDNLEIHREKFKKSCNRYQNKQERNEKNASNTKSSSCYDDIDWDNIGK